MIKILSSLAFVVSVMFATEVTYPTTNTQTPIKMDIQEKSIIFKNLPKKYTLLEFFGVRCPMCRMEVPHLISMQKNNPRLQVVAVEMQGTNKETLDDFIFEKGINYPVFSFDYSSELYKFGNRINTNWEGGIPMTIVLDPNGQALLYFMGVISEDEIIEAIKNATGVDINQNL